MTAKHLRSRTLWAVVATVPLAVAASLTPRAPDILFWGCVAISCAGAAAWGWLSQSD